MSCTQLLRSELSPCVDIDTVTTCNTKETLHLAHRRAYALVHRIN